MRRVWTVIFLIFTILAFKGCKERFDPLLSPAYSNLLVVEGVINVNGTTSIRLSRTVPIKDSSFIKPEINAQVVIEGADNSSFVVPEKGNGIYTSNPLNLNTTGKYRLHIKTKIGGEYLSEFTAVKITPLIDSISWAIKNEGVQIYANSHDPVNNTRYYKWEYEETWEIHSAFLSLYAYIPASNSVIARPSNESPLLFYCWQSQNSTNILTGSSARLTNDVISQQPLLFIPRGSIKTGVRYSILVKQYALEKQSYDFYELMKKSTESLGSIFDPQPSEITGNIICVSNPREKVIGFVTAASVQQKRIFITADQIGGSYYSQQCDMILVANNKDSFAAFYAGGPYLPFAAYIPMRAITHYYSSAPSCIDCRLRGTNVKPSFW